MRKNRYPGPAARAADWVLFFIPGKQMMHFDTDSGTPETHTDTVN